MPVYQASSRILIRSSAFVAEHLARSDRLKRPDFFAIIFSEVLAKTFAKKASGSVKEFVVGHHCASGHDASPRRGEAYSGKDTATHAESRCSRRSLLVGCWLCFTGWA